MRLPFRDLKLDDSDETSVLLVLFKTSWELVLLGGFPLGLTTVWLLSLDLRLVLSKATLRISSSCLRWIKVVMIMLRTRMLQMTSGMIMLRLLFSLVLVDDEMSGKLIATALLSTST